MRVVRVIEGRTTVRASWKSLWLIAARDSSCTLETCQSSAGQADSLIEALQYVRVYLTNISLFAIVRLEICRLALLQNVKIPFFRLHMTRILYVVEGLVEAALARLQLHCL